MLHGSSNRTLTSKINRLCNRPYENRYGTIRSGGIGGQFNFEGLKSGEKAAEELGRIKHKTIKWTPSRKVSHLLPGG